MKRYERIEELKENIETCISEISDHKYKHVLSDGDMYDYEVLVKEDAWRKKVHRYLTVLLKNLVELKELTGIEFHLRYENSQFVHIRRDYDTIYTITFPEQIERVTVRDLKIPHEDNKRLEGFEDLVHRNDQIKRWEMFSNCEQLTLMIRTLEPDDELMNQIKLLEEEI
ncbi:MAG: hypothetical protein SVK08_01085 [Halobacteriota archaeon]|nr:hypothetical protein [Halobacteriota archaeon]